MRINHNIAALNTFNKLNQNSEKSSSSMEKLASGLQINRAADDAAGLAISEKMRGQIRGLEQNQRNIQDGISLIQTAEGGLEEITSSLQRMRELAVQAGNDTLTTADRKEIQKEVEQIKRGIDEVANETTFNEIQLLNVPYPGSDTEIGHTGSSSESGTIGGGGGVTNPSWNLPENILQEENLTTPDGTLNLRTDDGYPLRSDDNSIKLSSGNTNSFIRVNGNDLREVAGGVGVTNHKVVDGTYVTTYNRGGTDGEGNVIDSIEVIQSIRVVGEKFEMKYKLQNSGTESIDIGFKYNFHTIIDDETQRNISIWVDDEMLLHNTEYQNGDVPASFQVKGFGGLADVWGEGIIKSTGQYEVIEEPSVVALGSVGIIGGGVTRYYDDFSTHPEWGDEIIDDDDEGVALIWEDRTLEAGDSFEVNFFWGLATPDEYLDKAQVPAPEQDESTIGAGNMDSIMRNQGLILQVGPNNGEIFKVPLSDVRTTNLGIDAINMVSREGALESIEQIDKALNVVMGERSKYGAFTNALDHIENNVSNYAEKLTSAESRIWDANMAKEIMNQTTKSILAQTTQAMLAQSNQTSEGVLQLLRGV